MDDPEREGSYYHPGGVPITPQAHRFGYEFPVYVSNIIWGDMCIAVGIPQRHDTGLEKRIWHLLQYCYDGMAKKLAAEDDFLFYEFKAYYWDRDRPTAKKMTKVKLGARLFLDPSTDGPWLYIFIIGVDGIDALKKGEPNEQPGQGPSEAGEETPASEGLSGGAGAVSPSSPPSATVPADEDGPVGDDQRGT